MGILWPFRGDRAFKDDLACLTHAELGALNEIREIGLKEGQIDGSLALRC